MTEANRFRFRAWFPKGHWWHEGMYLSWQNSIGVESLGFIPDDAGVHIMQSTGLTDKNGVESFAGDIEETAINNCKWRYLITTRHNFSGLFRKVIWQNFKTTDDDNFFLFGDYQIANGRYDIYSLSKWSAVIGNIHQNPELMEAE